MGKRRVIAGKKTQRHKSKGGLAEESAVIIRVANEIIIIREGRWR